MATQIEKETSPQEFLTKREFLDFVKNVTNCDELFFNAVKNKNIELSNLIFNYSSPDILYRDKHGNSVLHVISDPVLAQRLIDYFKTQSNIVRETINEDMHPLDREILERKLIDPINGKNSFGETPLHTVTSPEVTTILLDNHADLMATSMHHITAFHRNHEDKTLYFEKLKVLFDRARFSVPEAKLKKLLSMPNRRGHNIFKEQCEKFYNYLIDIKYL